MDIRIPLVGHALAALAYLVLAVLVATSTRGRRVGRLLLAAVLAHAAWAIVMALAATSLRPPGAVLAMAEALRAGAWIAFLIGLPAADAPAAAGTPPALASARRGAAATAALLVGGSLALDLVGAGERLSYALKLLIAIYGLMLIEQIYRNTPSAQRWALKFLMVAMLALFGLDLAMFSDALLYGRLDAQWWAARGYSNALLVPLVAVAAARSRQWRIDISVSRQIVFHGATLMGAGLYLLAVATIGWYARDLGGAWGAVAQAVLLFGALVALLVVALSGQARAWLRVMLSKHFFRYRYDYREEWLRFTERLSQSDASGADADTEALARRAVEAIAALVEARSGALWLRSDDGRHYERIAALHAADLGGPVRADSPLALFLRARDWVISVPEWHDDRDLYGGLELPPWCTDAQRAWLVVPLPLRGELLGFVVLGPPKVPVAIDWEVIDLLKTAGRQAAGALGQQVAAGALLQARQFESFNRMSAFVVHDLKNLVAQLSLLMANAARHRDNPEFQADMLATVENVLDRMRGLLLQLRVGARPIEQPAPLVAAEVLRSALAAKPGLRPEPSLEIEPGATALVVRAHRDRLERVLGHLLQNAAEATRPGGRIVARLRAGDAGGALIEVEDDGRGMNEEFVRTRLFRPFQSTKAHGMGIGTFESRDYVRELGGTLDVDSRERVGTIFRIWLPAASLSAETPMPEQPAAHAA